MVDMVLAVQRDNIGTPQGSSTLVAQQAKPAEVVSLAQRVLSLVIAVTSREELGRYYLATVLFHGKISTSLVSGR